uniref:Ammonium transporter n=1 Tax=Heterosigma akashiwo TaxID=2829 RepID=A0A7S4DAS9_HETAK
MSNFTDNEVSILDRIAELEKNSTHSDLLFLLICAFDIFLMQAGFALLEVGTVQAKNAKSILFKNTLDMAISMILWWCVGFGLAGGGASGQTGRDFFHIKDENTVSFIHSYVFAGTTATIVSGGVAERMNFTAYLLFSVVMVGLVYPLLAFWGWSSDGFLAQLGYKDFAGSGLIHLCGGLAALIGAKLVGPRFGRLKEENGTIQVIDLKGHSPVLSNFGTFVLLFGWLSFNGSSVLAGGTADLILASRAITNTLLSVAGAALTSYFDDSRPRPDGSPSTHDLAALNNAMLAGAVGITAGCAFVKGWAALVIGAVSYGVFKYFSLLVLAHKIDDPLEASSVHGACGMWGVLAVGLFAHPELTGGTPSSTGVFLGGGGYLLGLQILGCVLILLWTGVVTLISFKVLDRIPGCQLRVDKDAELLGLDFAHHDGFAYAGLSNDTIAHFHEIKAAERRAQARSAGLPPRTKKVLAKRYTSPIIKPGPSQRKMSATFPWSRFAKSATICTSDSRESKSNQNVFAPASSLAVAGSGWGDAGAGATATAVSGGGSAVGSGLGLPPHHVPGQPLPEIRAVQHDARQPVGPDSGFGEVVGETKQSIR